MSAPRKVYGVTWVGVVGLVLAVLAVVGAVVWALFPSIIASAKREAIASIDSNDLQATIRQLKPADLLTALSDTVQGWRAK